jgi:hypothetical protein
MFLMSVVVDGAGERYFDAQNLRSRKTRGGQKGVISKGWAVEQFARPVKSRSSSFEVTM